MAQAPKLNCPTCGRAIEWSPQYPFRPFCCERCKLIDLGAWLKEERRIPGQGMDDGAMPRDPPEDEFR